MTDGTGRVIARSHDAEKFIGKPVPDWKTLRALNRTSGIFEARMIEGPNIIFAFRIIPGTPGWAAVVGEPLSAFNARWRQPLLVLLSVSAATIFIAFFFTVFLARRMLQPIKHLAKRARAVAEGKGEQQAITNSVSPSFVAEFETLRQSLEGAEIETRRSHEALHKSYDALRQAEKLARIGSWTLDLKNQRFTCSDTLYEINGVDPAGPPLMSTDFQKLLSPESHRKMKIAVAKCIETGESYGMEVEHLRVNGPSFAAYVRGQALRDETGCVVAITGTVQDISEREEERQRLAALADNLPSGAIYRVEQQVGGELAVTYISAGIEQLIGVSASEIVADYSTLLRAIHIDDVGGFKAAMERSGIEEAPFDHQFRIHTRDNRLIWMHCRSAPRQQFNGRFVWDGIARDITNERMAANALNEAKETAEAAERAKSEFLATMSHEIRTPMNTVIGMTRLTLQTDLLPKQRNYLEKINVSAKALLGIINDILDFSKIEAGSLKLDGNEFSIESVLESVSAVMAIPAVEKGLEIVYSVGPDVPRRLRGDALRLGQVLTNLVGNAIKFTDVGEIVITIDCVAAGNGDPQLRFAVRDTGIGLSSAQISGLFKPFTQAGNDTFRKYGGTGLGLAICKQLVEMMGGRIWVESVQGKGSTFYFTIANRPESEVTSKEVISRRSVDLKDRRVLIVDDNTSARCILRDMIAGFGMTAEAVDSGIKALDLVRSEAERGMPFDLVVLDWRMPVMDGLETARRIRNDADVYKMPAVLMVTAYDWDEVLQGTEQLDLEGVLIKPVTESVMFNTILNVLSPQSSMQGSRETVGMLANQSMSYRMNPQYSQLSGKRILVVDDNALNREVASDFLVAVGVEIDTAVDGLDALDKLQLQGYDAVLMDMHMPRMDGLSAVRKIREQERWRLLPVIALTAQARIEDQAASYEAGMTAHLTKPIDETVLYRTLIDVLSNMNTSACDDATKKISTLQTLGTINNGKSDFSLEKTLERFGGRTAQVERVLKGFLRDFSDVSQKFEDHLRKEDREAIALLVHTMKGSLGYFASKDFCDIVNGLDHSIRYGESLDKIEMTILAFRGRFENLLIDIEGGIGELDTKVKS